MTPRLRIVLVVITLCVPALTPAQPPTGSDTATDRAVRRALAYLDRTQDGEGSWKTHDRKSAGVTGLCIMAYLSAGHTPLEGEYSRNIQNGIKWILYIQKPNGVLATDNNFEMYHHGICTLMLAEAVGMTDAKLADELRPKLAKAVDIILKAQRTEGVHRGGWRYQINSHDADLSVTGWQLLALRAAKNVGCDVPVAAIDRAVEYIKRCFDTGRGSFGYMPQGQLTVTCAGTGILGLELSGKKLHRTPESLRAGALVLKNLPRLDQQHCFYGLYYCSQAMFQLGDNYWNVYRDHIQQLLVTNQKNSGAWESREGEGRMAGPNYCTAMGVLALTVEYRFLPIYQRGEEPNPEAKDKP